MRLESAANVRKELTQISHEICSVFRLKGATIIVSGSCEDRIEFCGLDMSLANSMRVLPILHEFFQFDVSFADLIATFGKKTKQNKTNKKKTQQKKKAFKCKDNLASSHF